MRRARLTYQGAHHHVMSKAIPGELIFKDRRNKVHFLQLLSVKSKQYKMDLLAYCIMPNHFHLVLQNTSGLLSYFMRELNGEFGMYYRKTEGGHGYVFASRFKSILVQDGQYLQNVVLYVLMNPVRAGLAIVPYEYQWSSIGEYDNDTKADIIDRRLFKQVFPTRVELFNALATEVPDSLDATRTRAGMIIGDDSFIASAIKKFDRRKENKRSQRKRIVDFTFIPANKLILDFERQYQINIDNIDTNTYYGKDLRNELLVLLKDKAGLKFSEIMRYPLFQSYKYSSLSKTYHRYRKKDNEE